jgi:protein-tyrosine phosphatase
MPRPFHVKHGEGKGLDPCSTTRVRHVVTHCRGGIDRSSLLAGALLVMDGASPEAAWQAISEARGRNVPETDEQRAWLTTFARARIRDRTAA